MGKGAVLFAGYPLSDAPFGRRLLSPVAFAQAAERCHSSAEWLATRSRMKEDQIEILPTDRSYDSLLAKAYEGLVPSEKVFLALKGDLHAMRKRLTLPPLEETLRSYALLALATLGKSEKRWEETRRRGAAAAKSGSFLATTHKTVLDAYFLDAWDLDRAGSFLAMARRLISDEAALSGALELSRSVGMEALSALPLPFAPSQSLTFLKMAYGPRAEGRYASYCEAVFKAAIIAFGDKGFLRTDFLDELHDLRILVSLAGEKIVYDAKDPFWLRQL